MKIDKIVLNQHFSQKLIIQNQTANEPTRTQENNELSNIYYLPFLGRVDKGLQRFYETNSERMPITVKHFIEKLSDKTLSPLQAQAAAFAGLATATSVAMVKELFPEEDLFKNLKETSETKATRGILYAYRDNKELLELCNESILTTKENFTVWLLKKIFIESKTLDEINKNFEEEINPEFKKLSQMESSDELVLHSSTLKGLGIQMPAHEYLQSLRYTRAGYSDIVGEKISQAQIDFWNSLTPEQRTAKNRKKVENFENWWLSLSRNTKLEMIAFQLSELEMYELYGNSGIFQIKKDSNKKRIQKDKIFHSNSKDATKNSSKLSDDELFKIWAGNNLKLYEASLTEKDKKDIEILREQHRAEWWNSMSVEEKTDYINSLKAGSEPLRYAMIDAWNNNPDIIIALSQHLKKNSIKRPTEILYSGESFNESQSKLMTIFWAENPEYATKLGISIHESHEKIKDYINRGKFEFLKVDIMKARAQREKETFLKLKELNRNQNTSVEEVKIYPKHIQEFITTYESVEADLIKFLPKEYLKDFYSALENDLNEEQVISWTKVLKNETMTDNDYKNIKDIRAIETENTFKMNRALELAFANVLYEATKNPQVYILSQSDCKVAMKQLMSKKSEIKLFSNKLNKKFTFAIINNKPDMSKIDTTYADGKKQSENSIADIFEQYININTEKEGFSPKKAKYLQEFMYYYINLYGKTADVIFSPGNKYTPEIKENFMLKFMYNIPPEISAESYNFSIMEKDDFIKENRITHLNRLIEKKYSFIPKEALRPFNLEFNKYLKHLSNHEISLIERYGCTKKKTPDLKCLMLNLDKSTFLPHNKFFITCLEQVLADITYEITNEDKVYALTATELLEMLEGISLIKKYPYYSKVTSSILDETFDVKINKKPNFNNMGKRLSNYSDELLEYLNECSDESKKLDEEEIVMILNQDENKVLVDKYTALRISGMV